MATIDEKIWAVSEAYSMQPYRYVVGDTFNPTNKGLSNNQMAVINEIIIETYEKPSQTAKYYVVGYDKNHNRLFTFHRDSVNLYYFQELQQV